MLLNLAATLGNGSRRSTLCDQCVVLCDPSPGSPKCLSDPQHVSNICVRSLSSERPPHLTDSIRFQSFPSTIASGPPQQKMSSSRWSPVIIITGTPGTGKTTHSELLAQESPVPLKHVNVGDLVKEKGLYEEFDEEWQSYNVDEDKVHTLGPLRTNTTFDLCSLSV